MKPFPQIYDEHEKNLWSNHKPQLLDTTLPHWDPYAWTYLAANPGLTSAMVDATSASMATGCPNKPRKAVQKEGKVSSSNVLDPWMPWILRNKWHARYIFHAIFDFWLQMIYCCLWKPKKRVPNKKDAVLQSRNFSGALALKYQTLRICIQGGDFPDAVFSWWGPTTLGVEGPSL